MSEVPALNTSAQLPASNSAALPVEVSLWRAFADEELGFAPYPGGMLKFKKGKFVLGETETAVSEGTRYLALMDEFAIAWTYWCDGKPQKHVTGRPADGWRPPSREELGDSGESKWPRVAKECPRTPGVV